jgi:hypothetical protein
MLVETRRWEDLGRVWVAVSRWRGRRVATGEGGAEVGVVAEQVNCILLSFCHLLFLLQAQTGFAIYPRRFRIEFWHRAWVGSIALHENMIIGWRSCCYITTDKALSVIITYWHIISTSILDENFIVLPFKELYILAARLRLMKGRDRLGVIPSRMSLRSRSVHVRCSSTCKVRSRLLTPSPLSRVHHRLRFAHGSSWHRAHSNDFRHSDLASVTIHVMPQSERRRPRSLPNLTP